MPFLYLIARRCNDGTVEVSKPNQFGTPATLLFSLDKYRESKPDYRNKYIWYNCFRYNLMWDRSEEEQRMKTNF